MVHYVNVYASGWSYRMVVVVLMCHSLHLLLPWSLVGVTPGVVVTTAMNGGSGWRMVHDARGHAMFIGPFFPVW